MSNQIVMKRGYRPEIDGLRAFAVIAVIINHFNKDILPSGYLGVDIFFVISGYVITSSLAARKSKNFWDFISSFYERRIKRLVPALVLFVVVNSVIICFFNSNPEASISTGFTALFGLSNLYLFRQSTDYFASSTVLNIFTHTWSLGVEEQFYFLFPLLTWFTGFSRKTNKGTINLFILVLALLIFSLISYIYLYQIMQPAAYFLMPTRFWEIATGCILFLGLKNRLVAFESLENTSPVFIFLVMIGVMFLPVSYSVFSTILIVILSAILISCLREGTELYKFFTKRKVVSIGLISYSLYLWHWGVLSISRWTIGIHWWTIPFQIGLIYLLAAVSYKLVEIPFREKDWSLKRWHTILKGILALILSATSLIGLGELLKRKIYLGKINSNNTFSVKTLDYVGNYTRRIARNCHTSDGRKNDSLKGALQINSTFLENCFVKNSDAYPLITFVGDSHTLAMFPMSEKLLRDYKVNIFNHSRDGCVYPEQGKTNRKGCQATMRSTNRFIFDQIGKKSGGLIVATSYLNSHFGYLGNHRRQFLKYDFKLLGRSSYSVDSNLRDYVSSLKGLSDNLKKENAFLIVLAPLPQHPLYKAETCSEQWFRPTFSILKGCIKTKRSYLEKERRHIIRSLKELEKIQSNLFVYDVLNQFCDLEYCYVGKGKEVFFLDDNHLSPEGIDYIYPHFIEFLNRKGLLSNFISKKEAG